MNTGSSRRIASKIVVALTAEDLLSRAKSAIERDEDFIYDVAADVGQMADNVKHMQWFVEAVANWLIDNTRRWSRLPHFGETTGTSHDAAKPPLYNPREHPTQCEDCDETLPAGADPIDVGWTVGQKDGGFLCDECNANQGESRYATIPDDGYADGGEPYTDEEMDIIDKEDGVILEGKPTPPLARDQATETGSDVQDCFGNWHKPWVRDGGFGLLGQSRAALQAKRIIAIISKK